MITLSPISKNIQNTLNKKIAMLKTGGSQIVKVDGEWTDGNLAIGTPISTGDTNKAAENYMFARTPWLKMTSFTPAQGTVNTAVVLMGGELGGGIWNKGNKDDEHSVGRMKSGFSDRVVDAPNEMKTGDNKINYEGLYHKSGNIPYRPIAGVKDISIEYKGGGMKLGATRTGEINWMCWDWEQLDRLTPHFLHHGKTVLLEWGWSGIGDLKNDQAYPLFEDGTLNYNMEEVKDLNEKLLQHIIDQNGHYDAMLGLIQNFDWSVNENGGFDCNTTILSPGISLLQNAQDEFRSLQNSTISSVAKKTKDGGIFTEDKFELINDIEFISDYITFKDYMADFRSQIINIDEKKTKNQIITAYKGNIPNMGLFISENKVSEVNRGYDESLYFELDNYPYFVTWGWFEDNVLTRFFSNVSKGKTFNEIRSIETIVEIVEGKSIIKKVHSKFTDSIYLITTNTNKWLIPKNTDPVFTHGIKKWGMVDGNNHPMHEEIKNNINNIMIGDSGVEIRKIYFNIKYLQDKLKDKIDIQDIVHTIWNDFSFEYGGVYKFKLDYDDTNSRLIVKEEGYTIDKVKGEQEQNLEPYKFPVWEDGSIVKSQTINAKLPDRMQIAAMYGSNPKEESDNEKSSDNYDIIAAKAWGRVVKSMTKEEKEMTKEERDKRRFEDILSGGYEPPGTGNRNFGRLDADINKQIYVGNIISSLLPKQHGPKQSQPISGDGIVINDSIMDIMKEKAKKELQSKIKLIERETEEVKSVDDIKMLNEGYGKKMIDLFEKKEINGNYKFLYMYKSDGTSRLQSIIIEKPVLLILQSFMRGDGDGISKKIQPLIPIEFELEIDGTGGMFPGNSFHSSYLSQRYKEEALFQMVGVGHKIDSSGWTTSIKGQIRAKSVNDDNKEKGGDVQPEGIGVLTKEAFDKTEQGKLHNEKIKQEKEMNKLVYGDPVGAIMNGDEIKENQVGYGTVLAPNDDLVLDNNQHETDFIGPLLQPSISNISDETLASSGLKDMIPAKFGYGEPGTNYYGTISGMASALGVDKSVIEDNLKSRYNWNGDPKKVQAGWTFPR